MIPDTLHSLSAVHWCTSSKHARARTKNTQMHCIPTTRHTHTRSVLLSEPFSTHEAVATASLDCTRHLRATVHVSPGASSVWVKEHPVEKTTPQSHSKMFVMVFFITARPPRSILSLQPRYVCPKDRCWTNRNVWVVPTSLMQKTVETVCRYTSFYSSVFFI